MSFGGDFSADDGTSAAVTVSLIFESDISIEAVQDVRAAIGLFVLEIYFFTREESFELLDHIISGRLNFSREMAEQITSSGSLSGQENVPI